VLVLSIVVCLVPAVTVDARLTEQWRVVFPGEYTVLDQGRDLAFHSDGTLYLTAKQDMVDLDALVARIDVDGSVLWYQRYAGEGNVDDRPSRLALDEAGNVYVVGETFTDEGGWDGMLLKYDADGDPADPVSWDGGFGLPDRFTDMRYVNGSLYVAGQSQTEGAGNNILVGRFIASDLSEDWTDRNNGPMNVGDYAAGMAVDDEENIYVLGVLNVGETAQDVALVRYDNEGVDVWRRQLGGGAGSRDRAGSVAIGADDNPVLTASFETGEDSYDFGLRGVAADNTSFWSADWTLSEDSSETVANAGDTSSEIGPARRDIAIAPDGTIRVAFSTRLSETDVDIVVGSYDADGAELWVRTFDAGIEGEDWASEIVVDGEGRAFVAGTGEVTADQDDALVLQYDADGNLLGQASYDTADGGDQYACAIALDGDGNPAIVGMSDDGTEGENGVLAIKYCAGCLIEGECLPEGTMHPEDTCRGCDPQASGTDWSTIDGAACDDGQFCNGADSCLAGACNDHAGDPCEAGDTCDEEADQCLPGPDDDDSADDDDAGDDDETAGDDDDDGGCGC
jgi:hypothetical protein